MADPSSYRPKPGSIPTQPGVYRFRDAQRPRRLRRQGQEPALPAVVVLPGHRQPAPAHRHDGHHRGQRRVDRGQHRGRGAAAGVLLDQGVRPAVQREVPRRQVLPVARGHRGRGVPAGDGRPRRQEEGHPLLRPLQPRLGDPRDRRPAAAGLPDALVQQRGVQALGADRPARACSATSTSARRRASATVTRRGAPRDRRRLLRLHGRPDRRRSCGASRRRCTPPPRPMDFEKRRPAARRPRRAAAGRWRSRRWCSATAPTPT